jgi:hypothetical protein
MKPFFPMFALFASVVACGGAPNTDGDPATTDDALRSSAPVVHLKDAVDTNGRLEARGPGALKFDLVVYKDQNVSFSVIADFEPTVFLYVPGLFHDRTTQLDARPISNGRYEVDYESNYQDLDINNLPRDGHAYVIVTSQDNLAAHRSHAPSVTAGTFTVNGQDYEI